jgi:hypothetical protein
MGFKNSSAYFQREIDAALGSLRHSCCVAYIDDVCVYSDGSLEDHLSKIKAVMRALRIVGFSGNPAKCQFAQKEIQFLGHVVRENGIYAIEEKVKCMLDYQRPTSLTELRAFLGLMSYYRRFIKDFSFIAAPLTSLTKYKTEGKSSRQQKLDAKSNWGDGTWTEAHQTSFEALKGALLSRPVLTFPSKGRRWRLATDASKIAMGAVLSQLDDQAKEHPVSFLSRKLLDTETRWDIWELELAAVVWAVELCKHYLRVVHFELITDSTVVAALLKKDAPAKRMNLILRLSEYDFSVVHRKSEENRNADFMSRWVLTAKQAYTDWRQTQVLSAALDTVLLNEVEQNIHPKQKLHNFRNKLKNTRAQQALAVGISAADAEVKEVRVEEEKKKERTVDDDCRDMRRFIAEQQRADRKLIVVIETLEKEMAPRDGVVPDVSDLPYQLTGVEKLLIQRVITRETGANGPSRTFWPVVLPKVMAHAVLALFHGTNLS